MRSLLNYISWKCKLLFHIENAYNKQLKVTVVHHAYVVVHHTLVVAHINFTLQYAQVFVFNDDVTDSNTFDIEMYQF